MCDIDYSSAIPNLIGNNFNVTQMRGLMYHPDDIYYEIPRLFFFLKNDEREEEDYRKIRVCIESFEGNLQWILDRAIGSRKNHVISPRIVYETEKNHVERSNMQYAPVRELLGEIQYIEICNLSVADIPNLYQHMKIYL